MACTALVARRSCMFVTLKDAIRSMARRHIFEHIFGKITFLYVGISTLKGRCYLLCQSFGISEVYDTVGTVCRVSTFCNIREFCFDWNVREFCSLSGNFSSRRFSYAFANETLMICICN